MKSLAQSRPSSAVRALALGCSVAAAAMLSVYACTEYDSSLLLFTDAGADVSDAAPETHPDVFDATDDSHDAVDAPDASDDADVSDEAVDASPEAAVCSATQVDCDGDTSNGCETNLLANPKSCGWCNHDCMGTACMNGLCVPTTLAAGQSSPGNIAQDADYVYWANSVQNGAIMRIAKTGTAPEVVAPSSNPPGGLAVDVAAIYWSESMDNSSVWRLDKSGIEDGGAAVALATGQGMSMTLTVDDGAWVYWCTATTVRKVPKAGGTVAYVATNMGHPGGIIWNLGFLYWTDAVGGNVYGVDTPDGPVVKVATGQSFPTGITADFTTLYWADMLTVPDAGPAGIMAMTKADPTQLTLLAGSQSSPLGVAESGSYVYWTNNVSGEVMRTAKTGGTPQKLAQGQGAPSGIVVDESWVYWTSRDDGKVMRVAK